ncbi:hypothetical protein THII_3292 [Thioploca ingrica]|uniref:Uncharacterized protein n=1 Tax=Thioploca ingrica TaxID=40754 RepID=A0A090AJG0_9GAMM|nr:hypothetical protein THII_3292 [Thioploca ingrica]
MGNISYKWEILGTFDNEILSLEFISPSKGWMSELLIDKTGEPEMWQEYKKGTNRIQVTGDGGKTWKIIYESPGSFIEQFQYMDTTRWLLGVKSTYQEGEGRPDFMLYKSIDEGHHWEAFCQLPVPHSIEGFYFFDDYKGYVWTLAKLFATSDRGKTWNLITSTDMPYKTGKIYRIGLANFFYFIDNNEVKKVNPWENTNIYLTLPIDFKAKDIFANPLQSKVYILGQTPSRWHLLEYENDQLVSTEVVPIKEKQFELEAFVYGKNTFQVIGSTLSFFKPYHFYVKDPTAWHKESLSGKKNFEYFAFWENHTWAVRIALFQGNRELLHREITQ